MVRETNHAETTDDMFKDDEDKFWIDTVDSQFEYRHLIGTAEDDYNIFRNWFADGINHIALNWVNNSTANTTARCNQQGCEVPGLQNLHMCHIAYWNGNAYNLGFLFACGGCNISETEVNGVTVRPPFGYGPCRYVKRGDNNKIYYKCFDMGAGIEKCKGNVCKSKTVKICKTRIQVLFCNRFKPAD
jgi:hypothetical protein